MHELNSPMRLSTKAGGGKGPAANHGVSEGYNRHRLGAELMRKLGEVQAPWLMGHPREDGPTGTPPGN